MLEELVALERALSQQQGPFVLFGLFQREEAGESWDLVASAPWLDANSRGEFMQRVIDLLSQDDLLQLSRIVDLSPDESFVRSLEGIRVDAGRLIIEGELSVEGRLLTGDDWVELRDCIVNGMHFRRAFILAYNPPHEPTSTQESRVATRRPARRKTAGAA